MEWPGSRWTLVPFVSLAAGVQLPALPEPPIGSYPAAARAVIEPAYRDAVKRPQEAAPVGRLAMALHAWEQWDAAHLAYARAQHLAPRVFDWAYLDGIVLHRLGRAAEAAAQFKIALTCDVASVVARAKLADALSDAGEYVESAALYQALANEPAAKPVGELGLGRFAAQEGRHADAVSHLQRAVTLFPEFGAAHYALAMAYRTLGRHDEAHQALARHQRYGPRWPAIDDPVLMRVTSLKDDAPAHLTRGIRLERDGDVTGAITAHEEALARDPSLVQAHANLISLYGRANNWTKAEAHYRVVVQSGFNLDEAHYNHGVLLGLQARWQDAARAYALALEINPANADAHNNLGQILERERMLDEAAGAYRKAVESRPTLRIARFNLARMLIAKGRFEEAIREMDALRFPEDAETPRYLFALAAAHVRAGRKDEGVKYAQEARRLALAHGQTDLAAAIDRDLASLKR